MEWLISEIRGLNGYEVVLLSGQTECFRSHSVGLSGGKEREGVWLYLIQKRRRFKQLLGGIFISVMIKYALSIE